MAGRDLFAAEQPGAGRDLFAEPQEQVSQVQSPEPPPLNLPNKDRLGQMISAYGQGQPMEQRSKDLVQELLTRRGSPLTYGQLKEKPEDGFKEFVEPILTMATGAIAEPIAGLAGIAGTVLPGEEGQGAKWIDLVRDKLTVQPESDEGKQTLQELGQVIEPVAGALDKTKTALGDFTYELTGSPTAAAAAATTPEALLALLAIKGMKAAKATTELVDEAGKPTKVLRRALEKKGLDYESLDPEVKKVIPDVVKGKSAVSDATNDSLAGQIARGSTDDALAGLKVEGGRIVSDPAATEALRQGWRPGFVQSAKVANPETKSMMRDMLSKMRQIKKNERLATDVNMRPTNVVGDAVTDQINFIRKKADTATLELDRIAKEKLQGVEVDTDSVFRSLDDSLNKLDVKIVEGKSGLVPEFKGSMISKDKTSQRTIKDLIDLVGEQDIDAIRAHKLKRQIDVQIDYRKKSVGGLTEAGRNAMKDVRSALNESIREISPEYAKVNDTISEAITAIESMDDATGSISLFGKNSSAAVGQEMRKLMSNYRSRVQLEDALQQVTDTAKNLGGDFKADVRQLVLFANGLDEKFGPVAKTSFAGQIGQEIARGAANMATSPKKGLLDAAVNTAGSGLNKLRGVNDFNAFESLDSLLK